MPISDFGRGRPLSPERLNRLLSIFTSPPYDEEDERRELEPQRQELLAAIAAYNRKVAKQTEEPAREVHAAPVISSGLFSSPRPTPRRRRPGESPPPSLPIGEVGAQHPTGMPAETVDLVGKAADPFRLL